LFFGAFDVFIGKKYGIGFRRGGLNLNLEKQMKGIPVLNVRGRSIAEAWENSLVELYKNGCDIKTMYDKPEDPPSKDSTMMITIEDRSPNQ